jgi:TfoX/Sxy family transcriptional regulator of competence genes
MAYSLKLAERIRAELNGSPTIEKKMFGGAGYLLNGNMACGILGDDLIVRVSNEEYDQFLKRAHVKIFTMKNTPKGMKGWILVEPAGCKTAKQLAQWIKTGVDFALTLPPK